MPQRDLTEHRTRNGAVMSDRRDTTDTTVTNTYTHEEPVRGRQPVAGDEAASSTPPAESGVEMREDQTHPRGTSFVGSDSEPQMASRGRSLEGPNEGTPGGFAGISMGLLWTVVILLVVAASLILFFAL
jgi:hypothetical protein